MSSNKFARHFDYPFPFRVSIGAESGLSIVTIMGHNSDVDTATVPEDIWQGGGLYPFQSSAQSLEILSDDAGDTSAGTGARTVRVVTLDGSYNQVTQDVTMNGLTPVALTGTHLRVNRVQVITSGSSETNEGVITLRIPGPGATLGIIDNNATILGDGIAHTGVYTVPAGFKFQFIYNNVNILKSITAESVLINLRIRPFGESWRVVNQWSPSSQGSSAVPSEPPITPIQSEKTDIRYTIISSSANNIEVSSFGVGILIPNTFMVT